MSTFTEVRLERALAESCQVTNATLSAGHNTGLGHLDEAEQARVSVACRAIEVAVGRVNATVPHPRLNRFVLRESIKYVQLVGKRRKGNSNRLVRDSALLALTTLERCVRAWQRLPSQGGSMEGAVLVADPGTSCNL